MGHGPLSEVSSWGDATPLKISVAVFSDGLIRVCEQFLKKGSKVFVSGKLRTRKYQDQSGADRYSTEVVLQGFGSTLTMLDGRSEGNQNQGYDNPPASGDGYGSGGRPGRDLDDGIPFVCETRI